MCVRVCVCVSGGVGVRSCFILPIYEYVCEKYCDRLQSLSCSNTTAAGEKHGLNKGWGGMIGDIYQILNNQDTSVCTAMLQIKGPILCQHRCSYYSLYREADDCR